MFPLGNEHEAKKRNSTCFVNPVLITNVAITKTEIITRRAFYLTINIAGIKITFLYKFIEHILNFDL